MESKEMPYFRLPAAALAAMATAFGVVVAVPAAAQQPAGVQLAQAQTYSDEKLQSFAMAALDVQQIRQEYTAQIQQAESEAERQQLAEEANQEMVEAVETAPGITIEEYNEIIQASNGNPELSDRINQYMQ